MMAVPEDLPKMTYRFLGRSGLQVSAISLGGWLTYGGHVDEERTFACMKAAYDSGVNFFDCAEEYNDGKSEEAMGAAIRKFGWKRNDIVVSTKIYWGQAFGSNPVNNKGLSRKHVIEGLRASLVRMGLEYVDIVFAHRPDRQTPMEETVRAFNHLIDTGRTLYWGTSEWSADEVAQAWRVADRLGLIGPVAEQPRYNMMQRDRVEHDLVRLCRDDPRLGLTVFSPMYQGILSGKYCNGVPEGSRFALRDEVAYVAGFWRGAAAAPGVWEDTIARVARLKPIADRLGVSMSALALAWVLRNPHVSTAITGASSPEQMYENVRAVEVVDKLTPDIMLEIDNILENKPAALVERF